MKLVIFGLTISSSWGNGHATLWRGLCRALVRAGVEITFFEKDVFYYAWDRDLHELPGGRLVLYPDWDSIRSVAEMELSNADVGLVTSYCPDGVAATDLLADTSGPLRVFYDLDTPVTLNELNRGGTVSYLGNRGLTDFDLVLSYTGGAALDALRERLGARCVAPLYGSVDPEVHRPVMPIDRYKNDLSYLGTYAADRQAKLEQLLIEPARRLPDRRFFIGGAQYPAAFPWADNIFFVGHCRPPDHPAFFSSSRMTLNITRADMAAMGYCPSGRLFEAAACGTPILSDNWEGLDSFYTPGQELLVVESTDDVVSAMEMSDAELSRMAQAARERTIDEYTADRRAAELLNLLNNTERQDAVRFSDGPPDREPLSRTQSLCS